MSNRDECYRDTEAWPMEHSRPVPATKVLRAQVGAMRRKMHAEHNANVPSWAEVRKVHKDWVDAVWRLRENEMDLVQQKREDYMRRYRPILTLDGMDPHRSRLAKRELMAAVRVLRSAFHFHG